jgi:hypothetical protein
MRKVINESLRDKKTLKTDLFEFLNSWLYEAHNILEKQKYKLNYCIWLSEITRCLKNRFYLPVRENIPNK